MDKEGEAAEGFEERGLAKKMAEGRRSSWKGIGEGRGRREGARDRERRGGSRVLGRQMSEQSADLLDNWVSKYLRSSRFGPSGYPVPDPTGSPSLMIKPQRFTSGTQES